MHVRIFLFIRLHLMLSVQKPERVAFYINFCSWKRIPEPANPEEPVKVAGSAVSQISDDKGGFFISCTETMIFF